MNRVLAVKVHEGSRKTPYYIRRSFVRLAPLPYIFLLVLYSVNLPSLLLQDNILSTDNKILRSTSSHTLIRARLSYPHPPRQVISSKAFSTSPFLNPKSQPAASSFPRNSPHKYVCR